MGLDHPKSTQTEGKQFPIAERERRAPGEHSVSMEARVLEFNNHRCLGEKIDVEALMALKTLPRFQAHGILDSLEQKGSSVRNPSKYVQGAVEKKIRESEAPASGTRGLRVPLKVPKLPSAEKPRYLLPVGARGPVSSAPIGAAHPGKAKTIWRGALAKNKPPGGIVVPRLARKREASRSKTRRRERSRDRRESSRKRKERSRERSKHRLAVTGRGREIAKRAKDLKVKLSFDAVEALAKVDSDKAELMLEKASDSKIKNPSTYILSAINRGIKISAKKVGEKGEAPPAKRARKDNVRPSAAPDDVIKHEPDPDDL
jgi:hypothetical protein